MVQSPLLSQTDTFTSEPVCCVTLDKLLPLCASHFLVRKIASVSPPSGREKSQRYREQSAQGLARLQSVSGGHFVKVE